MARVSTLIIMSGETAVEFIEFLSFAQMLTAAINLSDMRFESDHMEGFLDNTFRLTTTNGKSLDWYDGDAQSAKDFCRDNV